MNTENATLILKRDSNVEVIDDESLSQEYDSSYQEYDSSSQDTEIISQQNESINDDQCYNNLILLNNLKEKIKMAYILLNTMKK